MLAYATSVTICCGSHKINISNINFYGLRRLLAKTLPADIFNHYTVGIRMWGKPWEEYDRITSKLNEKYHGKYKKELAFLYAPDFGAKFPYGTAKKVLAMIGKIPEEDAKSLPDFVEEFKELLKYAYEYKKAWGWN